jgi:hypothetical protein
MMKILISTIILALVGCDSGSSGGGGSPGAAAPTPTSPLPASEIESTSAEVNYGKQIGTTANSYKYSVSINSHGESPQTTSSGYKVKVGVK